MSVICTQTQWPSLARDLAILTLPGSPVDMQDIFNTYGLDRASLTEILQNPAFLSMFDKEMSLCERAGDKAVVRYRATTLSQALAEKLFKDAINSTMEAKDALKLLDLLLRASGITEEDKTSPVAVQTNVNVALPLPNVAKLSHCFPEKALDV